MLMPGMNILNHGKSLGLEYPYIYGKIGDQWAVWDRHSGLVVHVEPEPNPALTETACAKACEQLNKVPPIDQETLWRIDDTP